MAEAGFPLPPASGGVGTPTPPVSPATVAQDESTGTPANISAKTRSALYILMLAVNVLVVVVGGLLALFGVITSAQALAAGGIVLGGLNMVSSGLAVGYRPTRPGSPVAP